VVIPHHLADEVAEQGEKQEEQEEMEAFIPRARAGRRQARRDVSIERGDQGSVRGMAQEEGNLGPRRVGASQTDAYSRCAFARQREER
jgi:hypothetical protein